MSDELLPDSRLADKKNVVRLKQHKFFANQNWEPIFCANCGKPGGWVGEEFCTFACWLCDPCADKWGPMAGTLLMPDEVFWAKVAEEQLERYERLLTTMELQQVASETWGALPKLLKESPIKGG
jgi:hypothetical protein